MKQIVITSLLILGQLGCLWSQGQRPTGEFRQKLEAMKVAFITEKINLTTEQAQQFWPLYNSFQENQKAIRQKYQPQKRLALMSDEEISTFLFNSLDQEAELLALKRKFFADAQDRITIRQIALLREAEKEFNKEVLRRMMEQQRNLRRRRNNN